MRLFVDNLINVDFSYLHAERGLVGETWLASVELEGSLDEQGMVCDFGIVKKTIREWLDTQIDHRLLVPTQTPALLEHADTENSYLNWHYPAGGITLSSPQSALCFVPVEEISAGAVARWCVSQLMPLFPASVKSLALAFRTEDIEGPWYHYSHGLKKHAGNCQRIAHGHRSKIEIYINDVLALEEMQNWAQKWCDIYIGSEDDVREHKGDTISFAYTAQQGAFSLKIPREAVYLINSDSTVELLAQHIAHTLKQHYPRDNIRVKAYEGLAKGAIAFA